MMAVRSAVIFLVALSLLVVLSSSQGESCMQRDLVVRTPATRRALRWVEAEPPTQDVTLRLSKYVFICVEVRHVTTHV